MLFLLESQKGFSMRFLFHLYLILVTFNKPLAGGILRYQVSVENGNLTERRRVDCPQKRPSPDLRILHDTVEFDEACWQDNLTSDTCSKSERFCHQDIILMKDVGRQEYSLSILVKYRCLRTGMMRLLSWNQLIIDIHCDENKQVTLKIKNSQSAFLKGPAGLGDYIHILIKHVRGSIHVTINGNTNSPLSIKSTGLEGERLQERQTMTLGVDMRAGESGNTGTFTGAIMLVDLFLHDLTDQEQELEYQYIKLLLEKAPHPWCVCSESNPKHTDPALTCPDGKNRLTGDLDDTQFFTPPASLYDGIKDSSLKYGFWPAKLGDRIKIMVESPSDIDRIVIYAVGFPITVITTSKCKFWTELFCASNGVKYHCQHRSLSWENVRGEKFQELFWEPSSPILAETIELKVEEIDQGQDLSELKLPFKGAIPVYELILHGRSLDYQNAGGSCFPKNSDGSGLDDCGRCNCRAGERSYAGRTCRPYINDMAPQYGPAAGGTVITFTGGLLAPDYSIACKNTTLELKGTDICTAYFRNDTHIVCTTRALPDELSHIVNKPQFITVSLLVDDVFYQVQTILHYEYRPNPIIEQIHPKFSFRGGNHEITVRGKHLNSVDILHQKETMTVTLAHNKALVVPCKLRTSSEMVCIMPPVDALRALISFKFDGYLKYTNMTAAFPDWPPFKIHPDPDIYPLGRVHFSKGDFLRLKGTNLDVCCKVEDYSVMVGGELWTVLELKSTYLICSPPQMSQVPSGSLAIIVKVYNNTFSLGHLEYQEKTVNVVSISLVVPLSISVSLLVVMVILIVGILMVVRRKIVKTSIIESTPNTREEGHVEPGPSVELLEPKKTSILDLLSDDFHRIISEKLIDKNKLQILEEVGKGQFGRVHRGVLEVNGGTTEVALKTVKVNMEVIQSNDIKDTHTAKDPRKLSIDEVTDFLEEATIMRDFDHPNVLSLLGVMIDGFSCYVVLPFMENGDLKTYVSHEDLNLEMNTNLTLDVANGMTYLEQQKFVHRDLAARNCMVNASKTAVIGDFGLSRDIYGKDYYKSENTRPLPYKWMALECIEDRMYSSYSDVWAFGVLMWEIFMRGATPYPLVPNKRLKKFLRRGHRLEKPKTCPKELYALMAECWAEAPTYRPTFATIVPLLERLITSYSEKGFIIDDDSSVTSSSTDSTSSTHIATLPSLEDCQNAGHQNQSTEDYLTPSGQTEDDEQDQELPEVTPVIQEATQKLGELQHKDIKPSHGLLPIPGTSAGIHHRPRPQARESLIRKSQKLGHHQKGNAAEEWSIQGGTQCTQITGSAERLVGTEDEDYMRPVAFSSKNS